MPVNVQMDHTGAVTDVDYSPTGRELVSGSYDKTPHLGLGLCSASQQ